jgi:hypothetical protein
MIFNASDFVGDLPADQDTFYAAVGMLNAADAAEEGNYLQYKFNFPRDCPSEGSEAAARRSNDTDIEFTHTSGGSFLLEFSDEDVGVIDPKLIPGCPEELMTLRIVDKVEDECLLLDSPDREKNLHDEECRTSVPAEISEAIEEKMVEIATCANRTEGSDAERAALCNSNPFVFKKQSKNGDSGASGGSDSEDDDGDDSASSAVGGSFAKVAYGLLLATAGMWVLT